MSLTKQQALEMFRSDDLIGIGMEADAVAARHLQNNRPFSSSNLFIYNDMDNSRFNLIYHGKAAKN
jgi:hypothetical protein